ncbi:CACNA2D2 [Branchiostoma lanceolatum]|uniref:CACNA2D2 protein n=1 Tax=Branchiostoma lanceolatum TaxID=7740 RepID=A0A8K0A0H4_BRALA|nr:CACNA2D2 [Branchiostoma lanceolatum]
MLMRPRGGACTCPSQRGSAQFNMAATRLAAAFLLASLTSSSALQHPSLTIVNEWGDRLEEELYNIVRKYSGVEELKNFYRDHSVNLNVVDVDGQVLVQQTAKEIDGLALQEDEGLRGNKKVRFRLSGLWTPGLSSIFSPCSGTTCQRSGKALEFLSSTAFISSGDPRVNEWGDRLEEELYNIVRKYSGVEELKNFYRDHSVNLNVVDVDGQVLVQQTAKEIDGLLSKKMKALEVTSIE